jgi:hypothetical protein
MIGWTVKGWLLPSQEQDVIVTALKDPQQEATKVHGTWYIIGKPEYQFGCTEKCASAEHKVGKSLG